MNKNEIIANYEIAKIAYEKYGVDVEAALKKLKEIKISLHCWQGDDVGGFFNKGSLTGGIQVTGNYPGKARNIEELQKDIEFVLTLIPGHHKLNLHSVYGCFDGKTDLNQIETKNFENWVKFAKRNKIGLDFNPTLYSHKMFKNGFSLSSNDEEVRRFWIDHCKACLRIGDYFGRELNEKCVTNIWIPDGYKDVPYDMLSPRKRLKESLDEILTQQYDKNNQLVTVESKLFGIGAESYTTGNHEFYLGYAVKNNIGVCLDAGHFHPTESIADKVSSTLLFTDELLLHVSRPVRWDSDHVVLFDDELNRIAQSLIRNDLYKRTHIGLDFFDATINRIAAWTIGTRNMIKALLKSLLEPTEYLKEIENNGDFTSRMSIIEELKTLPLGMIFDYYCLMENTPSSSDYLDLIHNYEEQILNKRGD